MSETVKFVLNAAAVVVIAGVLVRLVFLEQITIRDNGMAPTLVYGDEVLVWKGAHADMADVMVCEHPVRTGEIVIGRVVAFAGHTIHTDYNGMLYVDQNQASTQASGHVLFYDVTRKRQWNMLLGQIDYFGKHSHDFFVEDGDRLSLRTYTVEKGVYLLGDNRAESSFDSREFGEVDPKRCLGQVVLRWKPAPPSGGDDLNHHMLDLIQ
jgi:signal peptidase I